MTQFLPFLCNLFRPVVHRKAFLEPYFCPKKTTCFIRALFEAIYYISNNPVYNLKIARYILSASLTHSVYLFFYSRLHRRWLILRTRLPCRTSDFYLSGIRFFPAYRTSNKLFTSLYQLEKLAWSQRSRCDTGTQNQTLECDEIRRASAMLAQTSRVGRS